MPASILNPEAISNWSTLAKHQDSFVITQALWVCGGCVNPTQSGKPDSHWRWMDRRNLVGGGEEGTWDGGTDTEEMGRRGMRRESSTRRGYGDWSGHILIGRTHFGYINPPTKSSTSNVPIRFAKIRMKQRLRECSTDYWSKSRPILCERADSWCYSFYSAIFADKNLA